MSPWMVASNRASHRSAPRFSPPPVSTVAINHSRDRAMCIPRAMRHDPFIRSVFSTVLSLALFGCGQLRPAGDASASDVSIDTPISPEAALVGTWVQRSRWSPTADKQTTIEFRDDYTMTETIELIAMCGVATSTTMIRSWRITSSDWLVLDAPSDCVSGSPTSCRDPNDPNGWATYCGGGSDSVLYTIAGGYLTITAGSPPGAFRRQ